jgi:hypothetical protein
VAISVAGQLLALSQAEIVHSQQPIVRRRKA